MTSIFKGNADMTLHNTPTSSLYCHINFCIKYWM